MTHLELKSLRLQNGLKQSDIADLLGIKQSYVSDMENGRKPISKTTETVLMDKFQIKQSTVLEPEPVYETSISSALRIIQQQADSLATKDEQINRLITLLENQLNK